MAEEAAAVEAAPVEAPAAAPVDGDDFSALAAAAEAATGGEPAESEGGETAESEPEDTPKLPEPRQAPKIRSARDRILAKRAAAQEREQIAPVEQQLQQEREQINTIRAEQARIETEAKQALANGDVSRALELRGLGTFEEVQKRYLEAKGAIAPVNPEVEQKLKKLDEIEAREKAREEQARQYRQQQEEQAEYQAFRGEVEQELSSHAIPGLQKLTGVGGFVDQVTNAMAQDPDLTVEQATADLLPQYRAFYEQLESIRDVLGVEAPASKPAPVKNKGRAPTSLRQADAAEVGGNAQQYETEEEEKAAWIARWRNPTT